MMTVKENMINKFKETLKLEVQKYFESKDRHEGKFILNTEIVKGSIFEKNPFCSEFHFSNIGDLLFLDVILGDVNELDISINVKVASTISRPELGKELNNFSANTFSVSSIVKVSYNHEQKEIEISNVTIR